MNYLHLPRSNFKFDFKCINAIVCFASSFKFIVVIIVAHCINKKKREIQLARDKPVKDHMLATLIFHTTRIEFRCIDANAHRVR